MGFPTVPSSSKRARFENSLTSPVNEIQTPAVNEIQNQQQGSSPENLSASSQLTTSSSPISSSSSSSHSQSTLSTETPAWAQETVAELGANESHPSSVENENEQPSKVPKLEETPGTPPGGHVPHALPPGGAIGTTPVVLTGSSRTPPAPAPVTDPQIQNVLSIEEAIAALRAVINHEIRDIRFEVGFGIDDYARLRHLDLQGLNTLEIALELFHAETAYLPITGQELTGANGALDGAVVGLFERLAACINHAPHSVARVIGGVVVADPNILALFNVIEPEVSELRTLASILIQQYNALGFGPNAEENINSLPAVERFLKRFYFNEFALVNVDEPFRTLELLRECVGHRVVEICASAPGAGAGAPAL